MKRILLFSLILSALLVSCSDDDKFSSDPSSILSFSVDSLAMDTVFVSTSTRTYDFWVYNRGDAGIRIREVRLDHPSKAGFRVNVDGNYVDSVAYDFEIRKGDSLRVFVELTAPDVQEDTPQRIEDFLIFALENGREQPMKLSAYSWKAIIYKDELVVNEDMVIDEQRPLVFMKGIVVNDGATLSLSNAHLYLHDKAGIEVFGTLTADKTLFRGDRLDRMFPYLPYDRVSGQWKGIFIHPYSKDNVFQDCEVRSSCAGISCGSQSSLTLLRCTIHNCKGPGLELNESSATIDNCRITNTLGDCLNVIGSLVYINHTTLAQFYPFSADRGVALRFDAASILVCDNTLVTGYEEDVIMGEGTNFSFTNCILRTIAPSDTEEFEHVIWESPKDEIQGEKHFVTFDTENLIYNFTIKEISPAYQNNIGDLRIL